jgi:hypothetical protein
MADQDGGLFAIEVDADDYANVAGDDTPTVSRTYQSEEHFQAIKDSYSAKIDGGNAYKDLITTVPILAAAERDSKSESDLANGHATSRLSKKDVQLLGYAVGELYYDKEYVQIIELCQRVQTQCETDRKTEESLARWIERCHKRRESI